jgi:hypothetical protein
MDLTLLSSMTCSPACPWMSSFPSITGRAVLSTSSGLAITEGRIVVSVRNKSCLSKFLDMKR